MHLLFYSFLCFIAVVPAVVYGQNNVYAPLVNIPGNKNGGFEEYINFLYGASISIAALLAVVKIIIAGAKYMMSDVITNKGEAIKDIQGAILGLLLILGAVIILEFINPQLTKGNIKFQAIPPPPTINANNSVAVNSSGNPIAGIVNAGHQLSDYELQGINQAFTNTVGNLVTYDIVGQCDSEAEAAAKKGALLPQQKILYDNCKLRAVPAFSGFCSNNYGRLDKGNPDRQTCQLPIARKFDKEFAAEFEAYKLLNPALKYETTPSKAVLNTLCTNWGGIYNQYVAWQNVCVKYKGS